MRKNKIFFCEKFFFDIEESKRIFHMNHLFWIWTRRLLMIVVPIFLVALEWNHPSGFSKNVYHGLMHMSNWWKHLHIIQSFLFGAVAVGSIFLTLYNNTFFGTLSKILICLFAISYLVFDSTAGIAVGFILDKLMRNG